MRTIAPVVAALLFVTVSSFAGVITNPYFNQSQASCAYSLTAPFITCSAAGSDPVIGNEAYFDIQMASVTITPTLANISLYFNYGGATTSVSGITLGPFGSPSKLPGDLFFYDPADPMTATYSDSYVGTSESYPQYQYGVPLVNHNSLTAGDLYAILNPNDLLTAQDVLDPHDTLYPSLDYRRTQPVWMTSSDTMPAASGTETISNYGNGVTSAQYDVNIQIPDPPVGLLDLISAGQIGIAFESATCANGVLVGIVAVPEPGTFVLLAAGIGLVGLGIWRRKRLN
jgi:PEP-CTERM motif